MKLKKIVATVEGMDAAIAALYVKKEDGKYHLDMEDDDAAELIRAKQHEVGLRQIAERDLAAAQTELTTANQTITQLKADAGKNVATLREQLEADYAAREKKLVETHTQEKAALEATVKKVFVNDVALRIANDLTDVPDLLIPLLEKRLQVEIVNGEPVTRVLTDDGKASTMTPDQLGAEYRQNKKFERIIRGSDSSGGGAPGGSGGSGASKKLKDMNDVERKQYYERDPVGFQRESDALKTASGATV